MHLNFCHLCERAIFGKIGFSGKEKENTTKKKRIQRFNEIIFHIDHIFYDTNDNM